MVAKKKTTKKAAAPKKTAAKKTKRSVAKKKVAAPKAAVRAPAKVAGGWWGNSFSAAGVLIAMAAVMGIVAFFAGWLDNSVSGIEIGWNGWQLLTADADMKANVFNNSWQIVIPLITFVLAIIAFIAIILPAFKIRTNRVAIDVIVIVAGLVMFILSICYLFGECNGVYMTGKFIEHLCAGYFFTIISSIVLILAGLGDAVKNAKF